MPKENVVSGCSPASRTAFSSAVRTFGGIRVDAVFWAAPTVDSIVRTALEKAVRDAGLLPDTTFSFGVDDPARQTLGRNRVEGTTPSAFYVMGGHARAGEKPRHLVVVATVQNGRLVRLRRLHRRG